MGNIGAINASTSVVAAVATPLLVSVLIAGMMAATTVKRASSAR